LLWDRLRPTSGFEGSRHLRMPETDSKVRRLLSLLLFALLIAAGCSSQRGSRDNAPATPGRTGSTNGLAKGQPQVVDPGVVSELTPPEAKEYRYIKKIEPKVADPKTSQLTVEFLAPTSTEDGILRQRTLTRAEGAQKPDERLYLWNSDGMALASETYPRKRGDYKCEYTRPLLVIALPLHIGRSWKSSGECTSESLQVQQYTLNARVERAEALAIVDEVIATFVILETQQGGTPAATTQQTYWFSPEMRLSLQAQGTVTSENPDLGFEFEQKLTRLP
jgi:hypothetical protein